MPDASLLLFLLVVAITAIVVLVVKYLGLQGSFSERVQQKVDAWRSQDMEAVRAQEREAARVQVQAEQERWRIEETDKIRKDSSARSKSVSLGHAAERLAPYLPGFNYKPSDARFLGGPVDFIVFDGLSESKDAPLREIVFVEVKTGSSALAKNERRVRDAVEALKVKWWTYHLEAE